MKLCRNIARLVLNVREAISQHEHDYTSIDLKKAVFLLAVPMVLEMMMESVFAIVDIFFVAKISAGAVAMVGLTESMLTIMYAIAVGFSMAITALVSRRVGEKKKERAERAAAQAIIVNIVVSVIFMVIGVGYSDSLLRWMGASEQIIAEYSVYTTIIFGTNVVIFLLFTINAIFRGAGDAVISMKTLWISNGLNIILDPLLIFGIGFFPEMGIAGAATATVIGRGMGVMYQLAQLFGKKGRLSIKIRYFIPNGQIIRQILNISYGGIGQYLISTFSWVALMRFMADFGSEALAGYTIGIRVIIFTLLPSWGMSNAAATLVGQNLGAGKPERAEQAVWVAGKLNTFFLIIVAFIFVLFPEPVIGLFENNPRVVLIGSQCLIIMSLGYIAYAFGMVLTQSFNGAGDTRTPTLINFIAFWLIEMPLAYILSHRTDLAESGIFWAIVVAESVLGILAVSLFRKGKWKTKEV